jgi:enterochelin esterase family protein
MRRKGVLLAIVLAGSFCWGQTGNNFQPASTNVMGAQYPGVHSDCRVTFQLKAPDAQQVQVRLGKVDDMEKGADGVWSVTLPPQVVGFHYYSLIVDGVAVNDPGSETFYGTGRESSGIEIGKDTRRGERQTLPASSGIRRLCGSKLTCRC